MRGSWMKRWALAPLAWGISWTSAARASRAEASPSGYRVMWAAEASAKNSRCRDTANWMSRARIGATTASTRATIRTTSMTRPPPLPLPRRRPPPNHIARVPMWASITTVPTSTAMSVMKRISKFLTCESS